MDLAKILGGKGASPSSSSHEGKEEGEAAEPKPEKTGYRAVLKEAAADGDWDAFADAVVGLCKQSAK